LLLFRKNSRQTRASRLFYIFALFTAWGGVTPHIYKKHTHALQKRKEGLKPNTGNGLRPMQRRLKKAAKNK
jgi:hypothetical protein